MAVPTKRQQQEENERLAREGKSPEQERANQDPIIPDVAPNPRQADRDRIDQLIREKGKIGDYGPDPENG